MENYLDNIKKKLKNKISFENLEIVDNSQKHKGHKFFSKDKYHLHLKIKSVYLKSISSVNAQRLIMSTFCSHVSLPPYTLIIQLKIVHAKIFKHRS